MKNVDVVAYFADDPTRAYQLIQWLPVLERLDNRHRVSVVTRNPQTADVIALRTELPVFDAPDFRELITLYDELDPSVALYCNNSMLNFQSLLRNRMLHVHINHGESDKQSMISNNAKAYDRIFVAGEAAVQRHREGLLDFDRSKLVRIGRPQLDLHPTPLLPSSDRRTVLYAPTWEGDAEYNDYTSVDLLGPQIVEAVLAVPNVRLIYKPHPKVVTSEAPHIRDAHQQMLTRITRATQQDPAGGHAALWQGDILAVFPGCDAMITDVSSVGLDWLYLHNDKPIFITDRHQDRERLRSAAPISRCADVIDAATIADLTVLLHERLESDEHHLARAAMRRHYFDDLGVGDSTHAFVDAVGELVQLRDELLPNNGEPDTATA